MGLLNKLKNILFEEEEIEIPVMPKEEEKKVEAKKEEKESTKIEEVKPPVKKEKPKVEDPVDIDVELTPTIEREIFKSDPTFEFPVFDEEDFTDTLRSAKASRNVLVNQKEEKKPQKVDFGKYENIEEVKPEEDNKFKPTPIISPVYGVLNQNYKKEDIQSKIPISGDNIIRRNVDIDSIRKKAYGTLEDDIENMIPEGDDYLESVSAGKTIDELLMDSADEQIDTIDTGELPTLRESTKIEETDPTDEMTKALDILDGLADDLEKTTKEREKLENDTLENDLFNLIDSMYDNRKDEED